MATIGSRIVESFEAGADLTGNQYYAVTMSTSANKVILATGASGPAPVGVLLNAPSSGQAAEVALFGRVKMACDGGTAIGVRDFLTVNGSAKGATTATASGMFATALQAVASGCATIEVLLTPHAILLADNTP